MPVNNCRRLLIFFVADQCTVRCDPTHEPGITNNQLAWADAMLIFFKTGPRDFTTEPVPVNSRGAWEFYSNLFNFNPSTMPLLKRFFARNQLSISSRCERSIFATSFIGSILLLIVRLHQRSRNLPAHAGLKFFRGWMLIIIRFFSSKRLEANTNRLNFVHRFSTVTTRIIASVESDCCWFDFPNLPAMMRLFKLKSARTC